MKNKELAQILYEIADAYDLLGVQWKPNAYRTAARNLETMRRPIEDVQREGIKALQDLPGIGEGIAKKIDEYVRTGRIKEYEKLKRKVPEGVQALMQIPGMGPKRAMRLYEELKIRTVKDLERAVREGRVRGLSGFGAKSEEGIREAIRFRKKGAKRTLLGVALPAARNLASQLNHVRGVGKVEIAGSIRRMKETIGDIDILAIAKDSNVIDAFAKLKGVRRVVAKGSTRAQVVLDEGIQADLRVLPERSFGAGLQYFTGNKDHNVELRKIAIRKGYKLSEYGLFKNAKYVCGRTEEEVYKKLGLPFIPPELRENIGEFSSKIPKLIGYGSLKGDLQMHSKWSDGNDSVLEMAKACERMGYKYMAMTDHSKSEYIAGGMDEEKFKKYLKDLAAVQKKVKIKILKGAEVDILKDGSLDYPESILKKLDVVVAAVHSGFKMSEKEMTKRICTALQNPHVNILAHPTGRIIGQRAGYAVDLSRVCETAKKYGVAVEINCQPSRLDLNDLNLGFAKKAGCKIAINTDAHSVDSLGFAELGIGQARRAGLSAVNVINTWPLSRLERFLRK